MKVLAKRDNKPFVLGPVSTILCVLFIRCWYLLCELGYFGDTEVLWRVIFAVIISVNLVLGLYYDVISVCAMFEPKILIEYDERGIYVNNKNRDADVIKYGEIKSVTKEGIIVLRIELQDSFLRVYCVDNVADVALTLEKMVTSNKNKIIEELDNNIIERNLN